MREYFSFTFSGLSKYRWDDVLAWFWCAEDVAAWSVTGRLQKLLISKLGNLHALETGQDHEEDTNDFVWYAMDQDFIRLLSVRHPAQSDASNQFIYHQILKLFENKLKHCERANTQLIIKSGKNIKY